MRTMITDILAQAGFEVVGEAETGTQSVEKYRQLKPDLVTMDIVMPDMGGIDAVREIVKQDPDAKILMCSAMGQQALVVEGIQAGAKDFVVKPFQRARIASTTSDSGGRQGFRRQTVPALPRSRSRPARSGIAMDLSQYAELFLAESREHLSACNQLLLEWERNPASAEPVAGLFRAVHTIKGMAATMGYGRVADLAHRIENLLDQLRRGGKLPVADTIQLLFRARDTLEQAVELAVAGREREADLSVLEAIDQAAVHSRPAPQPSALARHLEIGR